MTTSDLNQSIAVGITITNSGPYLSPFTVGGAGEINATFANDITSTDSGATVVYNFGSLITNDGNGIAFLNGGGGVRNESDGVINAGNDGIYTLDASHIQNLSRIYAGFVGVFLEGGGSLSNSGLITGYNTGVDFHANGYVDNSKFGTISATALPYGVGIGFKDTSGSVNNVGLIAGVAAGIIFDEHGHVTNSGKITADGSLGNNGVLLNTGGTLINTGQISGYGTLGYGFVFGAGGTTLDNSGVLYGGLDGIQAYGSAKITNASGGVIDGQSAIVFEPVSTLENVTVTNAGTIESTLGTSGTAIDFGTAAATLILSNTSKIIGTVMADTSGNTTLEVTGSGTTLSGIGTEYTGFKTLVFGTQASSTIAGDAAGLGAGQRIIGFTGTDKIVLDLAGVTSAGAAGHSLDLYAGTAATQLNILGAAASNLLVTPSASLVTVTSAAASLNVSAGQSEVVTSGGKALNSQVASGGLLVVGSSASATGAVVRGVEKVFAGAVTSNNVVHSGGREIVNSGGVLGGTTLAGGTLQVNSGGVIGAGVVFTNSGGVLYLDGPVSIAGSIDLEPVTTDELELGGTSSVPLTGLGTTINGFHTIDFLGGATWGIEGNITGLTNGETIYGFNKEDSITLDGFGALSGGFVSGTGLLLENNGATETLHLDGYVNAALLVTEYQENTTITGVAPASAGSVPAQYFEIVQQGVTVNAAQVQSGGVLFVAKGGAASASTVAGALEVASGGRVIGGVITGGETVASAGVTSNVTIAATGSGLLNSGGTASGTVVDGTFDVHGRVVGGTLDGGLTVYSGGSTSGLQVISGGAETVSSGAAANAGTIATGGTITVLSTGNASGTVLNAARDSGGTAPSELNVSGRAVGTQINVLGSVTVFSGASTTGSMIADGGVETVSSGGFSASATVTGGVQTIMAGGRVVGVTVSSGGVQNVSGGTTNSTTLGNGGTEIVYAGGRATSTTVAGVSTATLNVSAGGVIVSAKLLSGVISVGGVASATTLSGGMVDVLSGGVASHTDVVGDSTAYVISSGGRDVDGTLAPGGVLHAFGYETVMSSGTTTGTTIDSGGTQYVSGTASGSVVNNGGVQSVGINAGANAVSGGLAVGTVINTGGSETVLRGATASNTKIAGGTLIAGDGSVVDGGVTFTAAGGELQFLNADSFAISGFVAGDTIIDTGLSYSAGDSVTVKTAGIVIVSAGGTAYDFKIAGAAVGETDFKLSGTGSSAYLTLTKSMAETQMAFLKPTPAGSSAMVPELAAVTSVYPAESSSTGAYVAASSARPAATWGGAELVRVPKGGSELAAAIHSASIS